jgi:acyl-CoA reductase-like NAD-dependent aldehyde dehydrogenase
LVIAAAATAAAILTGNTVVFKPSPYTPLTTLRFGELSRGVLPPGVLNVISGGDDAGAWIVEDPNIQKIAFTGSLETGKKIMRGAAGTLKRLTLELGGNDAAIVLADADPKQIAGDVFTAAFRNCGQICNSIKRLFVHDSIYEEMCAELSALAARIVVGDGMDERSQLGPLQNKQQYEKVMALIADSQRLGARVVAEGPLPVGPGYFIRPTIVSEISEGTRLVDEEQFGPVLPVIRFSDVEEALQRANKTTFGLGASVWTSDLKLGKQLASRMEAGTVWVNQHGQVDPNVPFGGIKQSGIGVQYSAHGLEEFTRIQVVRVATA